MIDTKALRKRIIDLAISGKLNDSTEKSASEELDRIISILGNSKKREIHDDEKWTDIPANWTWARLADLTTNDTLNDGNWILSEDMAPDGEVKLIQLGSIGDCEYRYKGFKYLTEKHFKELNGRQIYPGYLLINRLVVDKMLSCIIPDIKGILITAVDVCWVAPNEDYYSIEYLMYAMSSTGIQQRVQELGHGVTRFRISKLNLIDIAFPMPPLEEQKKIVNTINELYGILNRIDSLQVKYSNDLTVLKIKIIDAGIQGKLTEQLSEDGDAEDLYAQILNQKSQLIKEGKIKKEKLLPDIAADEIPFETPKNWKWVRLQDISDTNIGLTYHPENVVEQGTVVLRSNNIKNGQFDYSDLLKVNCDIRDNQYIDEGDILICSRNGSKNLVGKCAVYDGKLGRVSFGAFMAILRTQFNRFLYYYLTTDAFRRYFSNDDTKQINQVTQDILKKAVVPLPPLDEQKRIVEIIDAILEQINS